MAMLTLCIHAVWFSVSYKHRLTHLQNWALLDLISRMHWIIWLIVCRATRTMAFCSSAIICHLMTFRRATSLHSGWAWRSMRTSHTIILWWWATRSFFQWMWTFIFSLSTVRAAIAFGNSIDWWHTRTFLQTAICCWTSWLIACRSPWVTFSLWTSVGRCMRTRLGDTSFWRTFRPTFRGTTRVASATCTPFSGGTAWSTSAFLCRAARLTVLQWTSRRCVRASLGSLLLWRTSTPPFHRTMRLASTTCTPFCVGAAAARSTWAFLCQAAGSRTWNRIAEITTK